METITEQNENHLSIAVFSPATYHQYIGLLLERMAAESLPEIAGMIRLHGRLTDPGTPKGSMYYAVKITDDGGAQAKADIPTSLMQGRGVQPGQQVVLTGRVAFRSSQYGLEARMAVTDLQLGEQEVTARTVESDQGRMTLERLRSMPTVRNAFPVSETITVALIQSASTHAQVALDARAELEKVGEVLVIKPVPINMLDPVAIARAIRQSDADLLILIRGGGDSSDFEVFDDPRVVQALAECPVFRVVGLGHTGNSTLLDVLADYSASTPTDAGRYVRERVETRLRKRQETQKHWDTLKTHATTLEKERDEARVKLIMAEQKVNLPVGWMIGAFAAGAFLTWLGGFLR